MPRPCRKRAGASVVISRPQTRPVAKPPRWAAVSMPGTLTLNSVLYPTNARRARAERLEHGRRNLTVADGKIPKQSAKNPEDRSRCSRGNRRRMHP